MLAAQILHNGLKSFILRDLLLFFNLVGLPSKYLIYLWFDWKIHMLLILLEIYNFLFFSDSGSSARWAEPDGAYSFKVVLHSLCFFSLRNILKRISSAFQKPQECVLYLSSYVAGTQVEWTFLNFWTFLTLFFFKRILQKYKDDDCHFPYSIHFVDMLLLLHLTSQFIPWRGSRLALLVPLSKSLVQKTPLNLGFVTISPVQHNVASFVLNCTPFFCIGCRLDCSGCGGVLFDNISHGS